MATGERSCLIRTLGMCARNAIYERLRCAIRTRSVIEDASGRISAQQLCPPLQAVLRAVAPRRARRKIKVAATELARRHSDGSHRSGETTCGAITRRREEEWRACGSVQTGACRKVTTYSGARARGNPREAFSWRGLWPPKDESILGAWRRVRPKEATGVWQDRRGRTGPLRVRA
jgi:hypothetical protein